MKVIKKIIATTFLSLIIWDCYVYSIEKDLAIVADKVLEVSKKLNIKIIGIGEFVSKNDVSDSEIEYIKEKTVESLLKKEEISIVENKYSIKNPDAIINASVYKKDNGFEIVLKLLNLNDLKLIGVFSKSINRVDVIPFDKFGKDFNVSDIDFSSLKKLSDEVSFRDSISDYNYLDCSDGKIWVDNIQNETIDIRAKYWAYKMKQPDFSFKSLTSNPGSEIKDPDLKNRFYELLKNYYYSDKKIDLELGDKKYIEEIFRKEKEITGRCSTLAWSGL